MSSSHIIHRNGKDYMLYAGLLDMAHKQGLFKLTTRLLQAPLPSNGNLAIVGAEVSTEKGTFCGIGDASVENVGRMVAGHIVRMAETRAKARALRDAVCWTGLVEGLDEELAPDGSGQAAQPAHAQAQPAAPVTYQMLMDAASWIYDNAGGYMVDLPETYDQAVLEITMVGLREEARKMTDKAHPAQPAQLERIRELQRLLGLPSGKVLSLSSYGAARLIDQLVRQVEQKQRETVLT